MLAGEPWRLPREVIVKLPDWYIHHVLLHDRDKDGQIVISPKGETIGLKESFRWLWLMRGLTETEVQKKWIEHAGRPDSRKGIR